MLNTRQTMYFRHQPKYRLVIPAKRVGCNTAILVFLLALLMTACSTRENTLEGDRRPILDDVMLMETNAEAAAEGGEIGQARRNTVFSHAGVDAGHGGGHLDLAASISRLWSISVGRAAEHGTELAQPVAAGGLVYTITPGGMLRATALDDGSMRWEVEIDPSTDTTQNTLTGGLSLDNGVLFAHAGKSQLFALDAETGVTQWQQTVSLPLRAGPTSDNGAVFVADLDGRLFAYVAATGELLWSRVGAESTTSISGAAAPAIRGNSLIQVASSGDLSVLDSSTGDVVWGDNLAALQARTALDNFADIRAHPVHDGGLVMAISQSGRMVGYNARTGRTIWEAPISGVEMPWRAGKTVFVVAVSGHVYALRRQDGALRWQTALPEALQPGQVIAEDPVRFFGPVVAGGRVIIADSSGKLHLLDANNGALLDSLPLGGEAVAAPLVIDGTLIILTRDGKLSAWR